MTGILDRLFGRGDGPRDHKVASSAYGTERARIIADSDAQLARLQRELIAEAATRNEQLAAIDSAEAARPHQWRRDIVSDARDALLPLLSQWHTEPSRELARLLSEQLQAFADRETRELGGNGRGRTLAIDVLAYALADAIEGAPIAIMTHDQSIVGACTALHRASASAIATFDAMHALESAIDAAGRAHAGQPIDREKWDAWRSCDAQRLDALLELRARGTNRAINADERRPADPNRTLAYSHFAHKPTAVGRVYVDVEHDDGEIN